MLVGVWFGPFDRCTNAMAVARFERGNKFPIGENLHRCYSSWKFGIDG